MERTVHPTPSAPDDVDIVLIVAGVAHADPRTVRREMAAHRGEGPHVRGRVGDRIRRVLADRGLLRPEAA